MEVFLFTDLEGSTRLWERHPVEMRAALARHDGILRDAVTSARGVALKTTGDGLLAVFSSALDAVTACLDAQRTLATTTWETIEPLRVRMGIHVGDAEHRDDDVFGPALNRTARIMAAGHGGQVLLSGAAAAIVADALPPGAHLQDLGAHRLKDLTQPEHLFQLVHPDLGSDFPPLATLDARPNNLPVQVSEFLGRHAELTAVRTLLDDPLVRLVTLTGPGGTGKTRLALQLAAESVDRHPDGAFFVDLSAERTADAAFEAVLRDLDLSGAREGSPLQVLQARLHDRRLLLVLDNFEQVTEAAVGVAELLQHCPHLVVVATSREALRIRGEHVFPVPPLSLPDPTGPVADIARSEAVRLFTQRARSVRPDFALTEENAGAIAEISTRLDGLPLALELAAARLRGLSPGDLRDRLRDRTDVLGRGARDLPARQRTLRDTIAWSYELLEPDERRVFDLMAVFSTARLDAVEAVATAVDGDLDVVDVLVSLVDKSLIRCTEDGPSQRYSMLRTIEDFAHERLAATPDVADAARVAHARHYARYASSLRHALEGHGRQAALRDLSSEIGNLRAAWRTWVEAGDLEQLYLLVDGLWALHEAHGWYHAAVELTTDLLAVLATTPPSPDRDREEMTLRSSLARGLLAVRGYTPEVEGEFLRALELSSPTDPAAQRFPVLRALATYYMNIADFPRTAALGRQLLELAERDHDEAMRVDGHLVHGLGLAFTGDVEAGLAELDRAIERYDPTMHGSGRFRLGPSPGVVARIVSAILLWQSGWPDTASTRSSDALDLARSLHHPFSLGYALYHVGFLALSRERFDEAAERGEELAVVADEHDYPVWSALASVLSGAALCGLGEAERGLAMTETGHALYSGLTTPPVFWPPLLGLRGAAFAMAGQPERALQLVDEAIAASGSDERMFPEFRVLRGDAIAMLDGDPRAVEEAYRAAIRGAQAVLARITELRATTRLVTLLSRQGRVPDGSDELRTLCAWFIEGADEPELREARAALGEA